MGKTLEQPLFKNRIFKRAINIKRSSTSVVKEMLKKKKFTTKYTVLLEYTNGKEQLSLVTDQHVALPPAFIPSSHHVQLAIWVNDS